MPGATPTPDRAGGRARRTPTASTLRSIGAHRSARATGPSPDVNTMAWADNYIKRLQAGETVQFRPRGDSMQPRIQSGQLVTVAPLTSFFALNRGDAVLCRVAGHQYLHLVDQLDPVAKRACITNARGHVNGWTAVGNIYGRVIRVDP